MPRALAAVPALLTGVVILSGAAQASPPKVQRGTVVAIVDPGSIEVRVSSRTTERVQLFGVAAPGPGSCDFSTALADTTSLALGKPVWLVVVRGSKGHGHSPTPTAYAILAGGRDLGLELVQRGDATVRADQHPFKQLASYLRAQSAARSASLGLWACAPSPSTPPGKHGLASSPHGRQKHSSTSMSEPGDQGSGQAGHGSHGH